MTETAEGAGTAGDEPDEWWLEIYVTEPGPPEEHEPAELVEPLRSLDPQHLAVVMEQISHEVDVARTASEDDSPLASAASSLVLGEGVSSELTLEFKAFGYRYAVEVSLDPATRATRIRRVVIEALGSEDL